MPRTVFFYNNIGPVNTNTAHSNGLASEGRSITITKSRTGIILTGTPEERTVHINAELIGAPIPGIQVSAIFVNPYKVRRRRVVWGGGFIRNKRLLWDGNGIQSSSERIDRLVQQHINF